jgi:hypothetical protein
MNILKIQIGAARFEDVRARRRLMIVQTQMIVQIGCGVLMIVQIIVQMIVHILMKVQICVWVGVERFEDVQARRPQRFYK